MLWTKSICYKNEPFEKESDLEAAIEEVRSALFGPHRIYLEIKKKIGGPGKIKNIPDGYLLDFSSAREPRLYVVENELAKHEPLKHIAVQILEFSLSFETSPQRVKTIIKERLKCDTDAIKFCTQYAEKNGFENVDYLLERMIYSDKAFNALVIIDELDPELETVLISRFQFPVEIVELRRFKSASGERLFQFEPFLGDITGESEEEGRKLPALDPSEIDTIVVPAKDDGFEEVFMGEDRWYAIRMHSSMINRIKHIAAYRVAPTSSITHFADVKSIEQWKDTNKYVLNFAAPAKKITAIKLVPKSVVKAPQAPRYTSFARLKKAKSLNEAF